MSRAMALLPVSRMGPAGPLPSESSQEMLAILLSNLAEIKDYVILTEKTNWLDASTLAKLDSLVAPVYEQVLSATLSEDQKQTMILGVCENIKRELGKSLQDWAKSNGLRIESLGGAPSAFSFKAIPGIKNSFVELLTKADMVLTLLQHGESVSPVTDKGNAILRDTALCRRLPTDNSAMAYGNYYYRLVTPKPQGGFEDPSPFDPQRKISILKKPSSGTISFP